MIVERIVLFGVRNKARSCMQPAVRGEQNKAATDTNITVEKKNKHYERIQELPYRSKYIRPPRTSVGCWFPGSVCRVRCAGAADES